MNSRVAIFRAPMPSAGRAGAALFRVNLSDSLHLAPGARKPLPLEALRKMKAADGR